MVSVIRAAAALALALVAPGCLGTTPEEARAARIGTDPPEGPTHNPGNDCLACHDFAVAGTVFFRRDDAVGLGGAHVEVTDAAGRRFEAITNEAGNFYVQAGSGGSDFSIGDEGETELGFRPTYPLRARVVSGDLEQEMITSIRRQGSCNACHAGDPGAASVGRIVLEDP